MSSSQGANTTAVSGYAFDRDSIRDSSDWTRYKKEAIVAQEIKPLQTKNPWIPYGNDYRLIFLNGKFKCGPCTGNAFGGSTGPLTTS